ncbi:MAG TPA: AAA family ATPase [Trebonia sp.]|nr:AAA family ATPase [Trebonia sp.]
MATLVGRSAELARLRALLDDAASGAVAALVGGDAGVGKSRLVGEVTAIAAGQGFTVLCGQCAEIGDSVPYLPFADAIRTASPEIETAVKARPVLARLLPDGGEGGELETDRAALIRQQMFGAVLGLLAELSGRAPVLLVLEDLHWADASTRDLLTFLLRMLHGERVAVIGTYRTDDLYRRHPLRPVVADLLRLPSVISVELGPLTPSALTELLFSISDEPGRLSAGTVNQIVASSEGNAYYAEELLAALSDTADGARTGPGLPSGLAALLMSRVERVSDAAQLVLRAAAVAGRRSGDDLVRAACGLPGAAYDEAVREAVANQLLVPDGADGYAFRHALLREAVYSDLLPGERTRLHGQLAALLSGVPGAAAELAHHSLASHDVPGAFAASIRAGDEARRLGAPTEAHRHYDQALSLWDRVDDAAAIAGMSRGRLALRSAATAFAAGDVPRAVHLLRRTRQAMGEPRADLTGGDADPELRSQIGERLAYFLLESEIADAPAEALRVAAETVQQPPSDPPTWYQARAMSTYALALLVSGDDAAAREWAQWARDAADGEARWVAAEALLTLGMLSSREGDTDAASRMFAAALEQAEGTRMLQVELRATYLLAEQHQGRGELAEAAQTAQQGELRADSEGLGLAPYGMDLRHLHFQARFLLGEWDHALRLANGFSIRVTSLPEAVLSAMALFIDVARGNAAVEERRTWLEPFWGDGFVGYVARSLLAERALWSGDTALALAHAEAAIHADAWRAAVPSVIRPVAVAVAARADRAVAARAAGNTDAVAAEIASAKELLDIAHEGARYPARPKAVLGPEGRGWLARADAEYRRAAGHNAPEAWEAMLTGFGPQYVYETARGQWRLAEALIESGRAEEAVPIWRAAAATATRLGAAPLSAALDALARRARLDPGLAVKAEGAAAASGSEYLTESLTDRERDVLRLLSRGQSNRQIGAELFISPKTASVHVSNILAKLAVTNRTEAAAIAHREGL